MNGLCQSTSSRASFAQKPAKSFAALGVQRVEVGLLDVRLRDERRAAARRSRVSFDTDSIVDIAMLLLGSCGGRATALPTWAKPACSLTNDALTVQ